MLVRIARRPCALVRVDKWLRAHDNHAPVSSLPGRTMQVGLLYSLEETMIAMKKCFALCLYCLC